LVPLLLVGVAAASSAATLRIVPPSLSTNILSGSVAADLEIDDPNNIVIYQLGLSYSASFLDATAEVGVVAAPPQCAFAVNDEVDGRLCIYLTCFPTLAGEDVVLAKLHLTGNSPGISSLQFDPTACPDLAELHGCFAEGSSVSSCSMIGGTVQVLPTATGTPTSTITPTPTSTPTPSATPTPPTRLDLMPPDSEDPEPGVGALPGGRVCLGVGLDVGVADVSSTRNLISLAEDAPFTWTDCEISSAIGPSSSHAKHLVQASLGTGVQQIDIGGSPSLLSSQPLFSCRLDVSDEALPGTSFPVGNEASASGPEGGPIVGVLGNGAIIKITSCAGDCDGNGSTEIGEVQRCVAHFLGEAVCDPSKPQPQSSCVAADADLNDSVSFGEVSRCVNNFLAGCATAVP